MPNSTVTFRGSTLTTHGKQLVARSMYVKGKQFIGAAALLKQAGGHQGVVLHLLCHGIEATLKGLLLIADYDKYSPNLKKPLGHNLKKITNASIEEYKLKPLVPAVEAELGVLNNYYKNHLLRYGTPADILVDPNTIDDERSFRRIAAAVRLVHSRLGL